MIAERAPGTTDRLDAAMAELRGMILSRYPEASFDVAPRTDPDGLYVTVTVDVEDTDEVFDLIVGRLLDMQVDEGLPVYVLPVRPVERVVAELRERTT